MDFPLPPGKLNHDLVFDFFWKFSVFECALKRSGFLRNPEINGIAAKADWGKFAKHINGKFAELEGEDQEFKEAITIIQQLKPRKQVVKNGKLGWDDVTRGPDSSDESYTLDLLKTVRNNLFHGGKYPDGPIFEITRDRNILRASVAILNGCYKLHPGIRQWIGDVAA